MIEERFLFTKIKMKIVLLSTLVILFTNKSNAQFSRDSITLTVKQVAVSVKQRYIDPEVGMKMSAMLNTGLKSGKYYKIQSGKELARQLSLDLRNVIDDRHLGVYYSDRELDNLNGFATKLTEAQLKEGYESMKKDNFGVKKTDILSGNIGYIDFKYFGPLEYAGKLIDNAMDTLANTNALIIDLRTCSGSMSEDFNMMFPGYFLPRSTFLSTMNFRAPKQPKQNWSYGYVPGKKYLGKPVYILTSGATFSGGEALAYDLQSLKKVTVVGDITGGAANPVGSITLNKHFGINMPEANVINAVTKTNWETTGVIPDVKIEAREALKTAQLMALDNIKKNSPENWKKEFEPFIEKLTQEKPLNQNVAFVLNGYPDAKSVSIAGDFNYWGKHTNQLKRNKSGVWTTELRLPKGKILYQFVIDNLYIPDPSNPEREGNRSVKIIN